MGIASDTYAKIIRDQYDDWISRFYPKLQELQGLATSNELMNDQLGRVDANTANTLANAQTAQNNQLARMGITNSTDINDNRLSLKAALATASAKNGIRAAEQDRQLQILSGAGGGLKSTINDNMNR